ncbi:MAG: hypothetical protein E6L03_03545, partial [Thaumarchaeota archaeon]
MRLVNATSNIQKGTDTNEQRTFMTCYTSFAFGFQLVNMFTPSSVDLTNPELKSLITNMCNFYHEKTGISVKMGDPTDPTLGREFNKT